MIFRLGEIDGVCLFSWWKDFFFLSDSQYEKASSQYVKQENEMRQTRMFNVLLRCERILCNCIIYET